MKCFGQIDREKGKQMLIGVVGIYSTFIFSGVFYQMLTKNSYLNIQTGLLQPYRSSIGFSVILKGLTWLFASIYNYFFLPKTQIIQISMKISFLCGLAILISSITYVEAIYLVSFPFINMAKSFGLLNVILVGVLCSRVKNKKMKLGPQKIIIAIIVTAGIILFRLCDPQAHFKDQKNTQIKGYIILFISFLADGLLPDFQAAMKQKHNPKPTQMLLEINKWTFYLSVIASILTNDLLQTIVYCFEHPQFLLQMTLLAFLTFFGQIFIYKMIRQFKQHIVPFVVTTRKIFTVGISLAYFNHQTSSGQIIGLITVFLVTSYEFIKSIVKNQNKEKKQHSKKIKNQTNKQMNKQIKHIQLFQQTLNDQIPTGIKFDKNQQSQSQQVLHIPSDLQYQINNEMSDEIMNKSKNQNSNFYLIHQLNKQQQ